MGFARYTVIVTLVTAASYEPLLLDFSKLGDLRTIHASDTTPRILSAQLLPNPYLSTG